MPTRSPAVANGSGRSALSHFAIRVGPDWSPIRAAAIWPIADALAAEAGFGTAPGGATSATDAGLVLDLADSRMIAPPRPRRRRERAVSSRAVFYQANDA